MKRKKGRKRLRISLSTRGTVWFKDKSKYNRKKKYRGEDNDTLIGHDR
jgi:hypothetical protein